MTALGQIRRYLYGGLNDQKLRRFRLGIITKLNFRGIMSYYPLVNDEAQLRNLDGWLIYCLQQSLRKREKIWLANGSNLLPGPSIDWIENIARLKSWKHPINGELYDLRVPSFFQISQTIRIALNRGGIQSASNPRSFYYSESRRYRKYFTS